MKKLLESEKAVNTKNDGIYFENNKYERFDRLKAIRMCHQSLWILNEEAYEVMGEETADDLEYNPNSYSKYHFAYQPSNDQHSGKIISAINGACQGFASHSFAWRVKTFPIAHIFMIWDLLVIVGLLFMGNTEWYKFYTSVILAPVLPFGIIAICMLFIDTMIYEPWLKKNDINTEYYSKGEKRWW